MLTTMLSVTVAARFQIPTQKDVISALDERRGILLVLNAIVRECQK